MQNPDITEDNFCTTQIPVQWFEWLIQLNINLKTNVMTDRKKINDRLLALLLIIIGGASIIIYANSFLIS